LKNYNNFYIKMILERNRLYSILGITCLAGYVWLYYNLYLQNTKSSSESFCMIKRITNIPCPSCGSTRSVSAVFHGDFAGAIYWNPLGLVVLAIMIVLPIWLAADLILKKDSLLQSYKSTEKILRRKTVAIPLIILVIINWIWNIYKNV